MVQINKKRNSIFKMILASLFLTLGIVLPFITGNIQFLGNKFLPMHVPVLICGFVCGWKYGGLVGFLTPLLRALLVGVPLLFPTATLMTFELSVYGIVVGFLYQHLSKKAINIYLSLLISMILGRLVWGSLAFLIYPSLGLDFSLNIMITTTVIFAIPGIIFQLIFIPVLVFAIEKNDVLLRRLQ